MKIFEVTEPLNEGGKSDAVRYNSEVGFLHGLIGSRDVVFNPKKPAASLPAKFLANPDGVYDDVKRLLAPNYKKDMFGEWSDLAKIYKGPMKEKIHSLGGKLTKLDWAGGSNINAAGAVDVEFVNCPVTGISIKAATGITLSNLTPAALGLQTVRSEDIFYSYARPEYEAMKAGIFEEVLLKAHEQPGIPLAPVKESYSIMYDPKANNYVITHKGKVTKMTRDQIMTNYLKNSGWQRVFGDWFQANWATHKHYATPLFAKISKAFVEVIEDALSENSKLIKVMRFADKPYFYTNGKKLYYVPTVNDVADLQLKRLEYASPDGTGQLFVAHIGRPDSEKDCKVDIYVRYANGMFEANPTARVQSVRDPEYLGWELLA